MESNFSLFLRQSYLDAWDDYISSLKSLHFAHWDYVILTASNETQAESYRMQIAERLEEGRLNTQTQYVVVPDPDGKRVGSGGATLNVLHYLAQTSETPENPFAQKRVLVIHSGGDSRRVPQYSAFGKLFSPVPRSLPDGRRSTLFDEFIISMAGIPSRMREGMLILSGDVLLIFNPLQIDFTFGGVAAVSIRESVQTGQNHGVYLGGESGTVAGFLHKMPVSALEDAGAVDDRGKVAIDTGAVLMDSAFINDLYSFVLEDGRLSQKKWDTYVSDQAQLNFYSDFLYPLALNSTKEAYLSQSAESAACSGLRSCREVIWGKLRGRTMRMISLSPALFVHFGTTYELRELFTKRLHELRFLDWKTKVIYNWGNNAPFSCGNSLVEKGASLTEDCYIENSILTAATHLGSGCVISGVVLDGHRVPAETVLHGLRLKGGRFVVRIYHVGDNPKDGLDNGSFLGHSFKLLIARTSIDDLWKDMPRDLWNARLYAVKDTMEDAVEAALSLYKVMEGDVQTTARWLKSERVSLSSSFAECDTHYISEWQQNLGERIAAENFLGLIRERRPAEEARALFASYKDPQALKERLYILAEQEPADVRMRIYYYLSKALGAGDDVLTERMEMEGHCFQIIRDVVTESILPQIPREVPRIMRDESSVSLPLRVNWGGGWSDTPPYCQEKGGTVLNAAITIRGKRPIHATIRRIDAPAVILESSDSGVHARFDTMNELRDRSNPFDPFLLHKAALLACGIIPMEGEGSLSARLTELGGGFHFSTEACGIPWGSGLGTSSILMGACVRAICGFTGSSIHDADVYDRVLCAEQIMGTGGGWQDQIGGIAPGIKLITTRPTLRQSFYIESVRMEKADLMELEERFALINTGQRRLARNLLREVMGRYIGGDPESIEALRYIQRLAVLMKFELERGDIDTFAQILSEHWKYSTRLDKNCTNTCIEQIFASCEPLIAGKMICGAGGGGFLQVVLKKGVSREDLEENLKIVFADSGVEVWGCKFDGMD